MPRPREHIGLIKYSATSNDGANFQDAYFHIVNPYEVMWTDVLEVMKQSGMEFEVVSAEEWVQNLSEHEDNPAYKLMAFYENVFKNLTELLHWNAEKSLKTAPALGEAPYFNSELLGKYINYWRKESFCN